MTRSKKGIWRTNSFQEVHTSSADRPTWWYDYKYCHCCDFSRAYRLGDLVGYQELWTGRTAIYSDNDRYQIHC